MAATASTSLLFSSPTFTTLLPSSSSQHQHLSFSSTFDHCSSSYYSSCFSISYSSCFSVPTSSLPVNKINCRIPSFPSFSRENESTTEKKKVLIINTNSGGQRHAVIGFYFAKELLGSGHEVTVMTVGDESSDKMKKSLYNRFSEIVSMGGGTIWGNPADLRNVVEGLSFDVVLDNNAKDLDTLRPVVDWAKSSGVKQFWYISSAGIYESSEEPPHVEGDVVKADASNVAMEKYIAEVFSNWAIFRPQYMIGSGHSNSYIPISLSQHSNSYIPLFHLQQSSQ